MQGANQKIGILGEREAEKYLKKNGFKIICRNWRTRYGEIDIIAKHGEVLIFVEVKTARVGRGVRPEENITYFKSKNLLRSAKSYMLINKIKPNVAWQIDVIAIDINEEGMILNLRHIKNVIFE